MAEHDREIARLDRRLKVMENYVRRDIARAPGGTQRAIQLDSELKLADAVLLPGDRVEHIDEQRYGTVKEWHQRRDEGIVEFEDGEQRQCSRKMLKRTIAVPEAV